VFLPIQGATKRRRCKTQHTPEASPWTAHSFETAMTIPGTLPCSIPPALSSSQCRTPCTWTSNRSALPFVLIEIATAKQCTRPWMTYERRRPTISSRGVGNVLATLAATVSRISNGKVVMFSALILRLSIATQRNAERRGRVSREKRCWCRGCVRRKSSWLALSTRLT
jgi:hypothetical protein